MIRFSLAAAFSILTAVSCFAANDITGKVVDSETGKPIASARVSLTITITTSDRHRQEEVLVIRSGEDGQFRFTEIPESECNVRADKVGYWTQPYRNGELRAQFDAFPSPFTLRLEPTGTLMLRVVDQNGAEIAQPQVALLHRGEENKAFEATVGAVATTGFVWESPRTSVLIVTMSPGSGNLLRARNQTFFPTFYPSVTNLDEAKWIEIIPGKEVEAVVRVTLIPGRTIRGRLGFAGRLISLSVMSSDKTNFYAVWGLAHFEQGSEEFRIDGLTPGSYKVNMVACVDPKCSSGQTQYRKTVIVGDDNTDNLVISEADRLAEGQLP